MYEIENKVYGKRRYACGGDTCIWIEHLKSYKKNMNAFG